MTDRGDRRPIAAAAASSLVGLAVLVACGAIAHRGAVGFTERRVFHALNDLPQRLYQPMWVFQQFGNLAVAFLLALGVAALLRRPPVAAGAGAVPATGRTTAVRARRVDRHWLSDVVAGALLGSGIALAWPAVLLLWRDRISARRAAASP